MDKKEARKILGLNKEASKDEIERRFSILLKKHKLASAPKDDEQQEDEIVQPQVQAQTDTAEKDKTYNDEDYSFEQVVQAYNVLMGYEVKVKEAPPSKAAPLLEKAGIDEKKARNFFYYYKYYILGAIAVIIALVFIVKGCVNRVDPDFSTAFIGDISFTDSDVLKEEIQKNVPEIVEPGIDSAYISDNAQGEQEYAYQMKAVVLTVAADVDLYVTDKENYEKYAKQGLFLSLDEIAPKLGVDINDCGDYILSIENNDVTEEEDGEATEDKPEEPAHLYGIDVSDSKILKDSGFIAEEMIASIRINGEQIDKAIKVLELLMK